MCQIKETARDGSKYFITFLDDYSRYGEVVPMKKKSEAFENFKLYMSKVERKHDKKIKSLQTENGREYVNEDFSALLDERGIERLTIPYTPEQNGKGERLNETLLCIARCIMIEASVPSRFWPEAITHANYIRNRSVSRVIGKKAPLELLNNKELEDSDLEFLKVFGCEAWA